MAEKREGTGFLMKQRPYLKLFILTKIGTQRIYGQQIIDDLKKELKPFSYKPYHSEIYRALQELLESGYIKRSRKKLHEDSYQEIFIYYIRDPDKVQAYKKTLKIELERCKAMIEFALKNNYN